MVVLGFDPGGANRFGWSVAEAMPNRQLRLRHSGVDCHAAGAIMAALEKIPDQSQITAAGIDSPLFWLASGDRQADRTIRNAMKRLGASSVGGKVQQVNSLRGACLIQGIMAAHLLRRAVPGIRLTESHPKALLWLLGVANLDRPGAEVTMAHLSDFIDSESVAGDHQRDATLGAVAAWAMLEQRSGWRDLRQDEKDAFAPVSPVEYWMPIGEGVAQRGAVGDGQKQAAPERQGR